MGDSAAPTTLSRLLARNATFADGAFAASRRQDPKLHAALRQGQSPWAAVLACADSRVTPERIFAASAGELFVVRVAGNVASSAAIASLEYAVEVLGVELILVLGHEGCGAVSAAQEATAATDALEQLLAEIRPVVQNRPDADLDELVQRHAAGTVEALQERSPILGSALKEGRLEIVAGYYSLETGFVSLVSDGTLKARI